MNSTNSSLSNCESVNVALTSSTPPILSSILPNPDYDGNITLNWSAVVGATVYYIYRDTSNITSLLGMQPIHIITANNWTDTVNQSGTYYYVVVAGNSSGNSSLSNCERVIVILLPTNIWGFELYWGILGIMVVVLLLTYSKKMGFDGFFSVYLSADYL